MLLKNIDKKVSFLLKFVLRSSNSCHHQALEFTFARRFPFRFSVALGLVSFANGNVKSASPSHAFYAVALIVYPQVRPSPAFFTVAASARQAVFSYASRSQT